MLIKKFSANVASLLVVLALAVSVSACSGNDKRDADRSANNGMEEGDGSIRTGEIGEFAPGSQEELVATVGDRIFFDFNSAVVSSEGQKTLQRQADWLAANSGVKVTVEGHCDERGTREYNLALGERRAIAVKNYLVSLGVDAARVATISYGKEHPEYLEQTEAAWSKNRRGVTVVTK